MARILLVDDDPGLLTLLSLRLRSAGFDVEVVNAGVSGLTSSGSAGRLKLLAASRSNVRKNSSSSGPFSSGSTAPIDGTA